MQLVKDSFQSDLVSLTVYITCAQAYVALVRLAGSITPLIAKWLQRLHVARGTILKDLVSQSASII
jgi:hypothetical protein